MTDDVATRARELAEQFDLTLAEGDDAAAFETRFDRLLERMRTLHAELNAGGTDDWIWRISGDWGIGGQHARILGHSVFVDDVLPPRSIVAMTERDVVTMPAPDFARLFGGRF